ncbi:MAG TPA: DUF6174 domain-containing protein [Polyangia bacterium]|nr:DUF6174 domain-containing protein [Polyangia bacterium]
MTRVQGILATLLIGLFAGACGDGDKTGYDDLLRNRALWESKNIKNYEYQFQWVCFCLVERTTPVRVTVEKNQITRVVTTEQRRDIDRKQFTEYQTIDGLFDLITDAYRRAEDVRVEYNETYGYPTSVYIDYQKAIADEELGFSITDFMPVESIVRP